MGEARYVAKYHMLCFAPLTCVTLCQVDICLQTIKQGGQRSGLFVVAAESILLSEQFCLIRVSLSGKKTAPTMVSRLVLCVVLATSGLLIYLLVHLQGLAVLDLLPGSGHPYSSISRQQLLCDRADNLLALLSG